MAEVTQILPANADRALIYQAKNFTEIKTLLSDGSVIEGIPVVVKGVITSGGLTDAELRASDVKVSLDSEIVTVDFHQEHVDGVLGSLNAVVAANIDGAKATAVFQISGTWKGKIVVEGAVDGVYANLSIVQPSGAISFAGINNDNMNGVYRALLISGYTHVQLRMSSYTSGTAIITINTAPLVATPYVWQLNAANLNATVVQGAAGTTPWLTSVQQLVTDSTVNSSLVNLAKSPDAGYIFVGTKESTLGVAGIQVSLFTNQNCNVYIEQSPDGNNWDISDVFNYKYSTHPNFGITVQAVSSYFRVRVENISTVAATTIFRLQSCLCPIVEAIPRALSVEGNLKVGVYEIEDEVGSKVKISPNGALKIAKVVRLVGASFSGTTIEPSFWTLAVAANGSGVQTGGQFELRTITAPATSSPNGAAALTSTRSGRYISGVPNYCRIQADHGGAVVANNTKRWGCFTGTAGSPTNGAMFELINGVQSIATYSGGTPTRVSNGSFNGDYGVTLNSIPSGVQTFEIVYSNRYVWFYFNNVLVHKVEGSTAPWTAAMSLPCRAENYNTGNSTTDTSLKIRSFVIMRYGEAESRPQWKYTRGALTAANGILKRGAGTLHQIINGNNKGTLSLYDALDATNPILIIDLTVVLGTQTFNLDYYNGLTIVQTDAASDTTVVFE